MVIRVVHLVFPVVKAWERADKLHLPAIVRYRHAKEHSLAPLCPEMLCGGFSARLDRSCFPSTYFAGSVPRRPMRSGQYVVILVRECDSYAWPV